MFGELSHGVTRTLFTLDISTRVILPTDQFFVVSFIETWNPTKMGEKNAKANLYETLHNCVTMDITDKSFSVWCYFPGEDIYFIIFMYTEMPLLSERIEKLVKHGAKS